MDGALAGGHFIEDEAQRVDVRPPVGGFPFPLFRGHVRRRTDDDVARRERFVWVCLLFRQTEIEHFHARSGEHDVARLQVAVHDSLCVCLG